MKRSIQFLAAVSCAGAAVSQPVLPAEFEVPGQSLDRLFAIGGVSSFQVSQSSQLVYEDSSYQLDINFTSSGAFSFSNVGLGVFNTGTTSFQTPVNADTFSITVFTPLPLPGGLELIVILRDDDNNNGNIDIANDDDEWTSLPIQLTQGLAIYNIPLASFMDTNIGIGNNTPDFASGPVGGMVLTFETSTSLAGGRIETPITIYIDHAGVYDGQQTIPTESCLADVNGDGMVAPSDFTAWINAFNNDLPECDQNSDGSCTPADFTAWIANFNAGC